jgi:acid phosphatase (class A)
VDRRRLILGGAAGLASACASPPQIPLVTPLPDDRMLFAQAHLELHPRVAAQHFDCAVGARFAAVTRPALTAVFDRVAREVEARVPRDVAPANGVCARLRPGEGVQRGTSRRAALAAAYGGAMARLAPDRATAVEMRTFDLIASEVMCGLTDAEASARGQAVGERIFADLSVDPDFAGLMTRAAVEVAEARRDPIESPGCAAERRTFRPPPGAD